MTSSRLATDNIPTGANAADTTIPVLDIGVWKTAPDKFAEELRVACHTIGFFMLKHNLSPNLVRNQLAETRRFFDRALEEKQSLSYENNPSFRGYMRVGVENTGGMLDAREQVELATEYPLNASSPSTSNALPPYERLKSHSNPYPDDLQPSLRTCTEEYIRRSIDVANCLRKAMCIALGLDENALNDFFGVDSDDSCISTHHASDPPHWVLKLISYPASQDTSVEQQGVGAHTDTNFLTLVLQDYSGGLQVHSKGRWLDVPADSGPDVFVCNLGEQAELLSSGYFLATPHRVLRHVGAGRRTSVALFYNPKLSAILEPLDEAVLDRDRLRWERSEKDSKKWKMKGRKILQCVGDNTFKSLALSHPEVFAKLHPDLELLSSSEIVKRAQDTGSVHT